MKILLIGHDVETFIKIVRLFAVDGRGYVARGVQRGAVRTQNDARRHAVRFKIDDLRPFAFDQQALLFQFFDDGSHLVVIKTFARPTVEMYVQKVVYPAHLFEGQFFEPLEEREALLVLVLDFFEKSARLVVERSVLFRLFVKTHVERVEGAQASLFDLFFRAPALVGADEFAELCAVIAQMVDPDRFIT